MLRPSQVMVGQDQLRIEDQLRLLHICMGKFGDLELQKTIGHDMNQC